MHYYMSLHAVLPVITCYGKTLHANYMSLHDAASGHYMLNYMSIAGIVTSTCYYMLP